MGEEDFKQAFEDRPAVGAMSVSSLEAELTKVEEILVNTDLNWETRATAVGFYRAICCYAFLLVNYCMGHLLVPLLLVKVLAVFCYCVCS